MKWINKVKKVKLKFKNLAGDLIMRPTVAGRSDFDFCIGAFV